MTIPSSRKEAISRSIDVPSDEGILRSTSPLYNRDRLAVGTRTTYRIPRRAGVPTTSLVSFSNEELGQLATTREVYLNTFRTYSERNKLLSKAFYYARRDYVDDDPLIINGERPFLAGCRLGEAYTRESPEMYEFVVDFASQRFISDTYFRQQTVDDVPEQALPLSRYPSRDTYLMRNLRRCTVSLPSRVEINLVELSWVLDPNQLKTNESLQLLVRLLGKEGLFPVTAEGEPLLTLS